MATNEEAAMMVGLSEAGPAAARGHGGRGGAVQRVGAPGPAQAQGQYMMPNGMVPGNYVGREEDGWGVNMAAMMGHGGVAGHAGMQPMMGQAVAVPWPAASIVAFKDQEIQSLNNRLAEKDSALKQHQTNLHSLQTQNKQLRAKLEEAQSLAAAAKKDATAPTAPAKDTVPLSDHQAVQAELQKCKKQIESLQKQLSAEKSSAVDAAAAASAALADAKASDTTVGTNTASELSAADKLLFEKGKQALHLWSVFRAGFQLLDSDDIPQSLGSGLGGVLSMGPSNGGYGHTGRFGKARGAGAAAGRTSSAAARATATDADAESDEEAAAEALIQSMKVSSRSGGAAKAKGALQRGQKSQVKPKDSADIRGNASKARSAQQQKDRAEDSGSEDSDDESTSSEDMIWCIPNQARGAPPNWMADYMAGLYSGKSDPREHDAELKPKSEVSNRWLKYSEEWEKLQKKAAKKAKQQPEDDSNALSSARAALLLASAAQGGLGLGAKGASSGGRRSFGLLGTQEDSEDGSSSGDEDDSSSESKARPSKKGGRPRKEQEASASERTKVKDRWVDLSSAAQHLQCPFPDCSTAFKNIEFVVQHVQNTHTRGNQCELCDFSSRKKELLRSHVIEHTEHLVASLSQDQQQVTAKAAPPAASKKGGRPPSAGPNKRRKQETAESDDDGDGSEGSDADNTSSSDEESSDHEGEYIERLVDGKKRVYCPAAPCDFSRAHYRDLHSHIRDHHRELLKCVCGAKADTVRQIKQHKEECPKAAKEGRADGKARASSLPRAQKSASASARPVPSTLTGQVIKSGGIACAYPGCTSLFVSGSFDRAFRAHARTNHDISTGGTWFICVEPGCDFYSPSEAGLQEHLVDHEKVSVMQAAGKNMPAVASKPAGESVKGREVGAATAPASAARGGASDGSDRARDASKGKGGTEPALRPCPWPGCPKRYTKLSESDYNYHLQEEHVTGRVCSYPRCGMEFKSREGAKGHILLAHGFKIDVDGQEGLSNLDKKAGPVRKAAGFGVGEEAESESVVVRHECPAPGCTFSRVYIGDMDRHLRTEHPELLQCSSCGQEFKKVPDAEAHRASCTGGKAGGAGSGTGSGSTPGVATASTAAKLGMAATSTARAPTGFAIKKMGANGKPVDREGVLCHCPIQACDVTKKYMRDVDAHVRQAHPDHMRCNNPGCKEEFLSTAARERHIAACPFASTSAGASASSARSTALSAGSVAAGSGPASPAASTKKRKRVEEGTAAAPAPAASTAERKAAEITVIDDDEPSGPGGAGTSSGAEHGEVAEPEEFMAGAS